MNKRNRTMGNSGQIKQPIRSGPQVMTPCPGGAVHFGGRRPKPVTAEDFDANRPDTHPSNSSSLIYSVVGTKGTEEIELGSMADLEMAHRRLASIEAMDEFDSVKIIKK